VGSGREVGVRRAGVRIGAFVVGVALIWLAVALLAQVRPVDLAAVLLVMLAAVVAVALLTGPVLGIVAAVAAVVLVNWYLVPPYGTFEVASTENVVALVVFPLVAGVSAVLMEIGARARARAASAGERAALVARVSGSPERSLDELRRALDLDELTLQSGGRVVATSGQAVPSRGVVVDVAGPDGYRLVGSGVDRIAEDPAFLTSLATAAVRSYESGRLADEARRADELAAVDRARSALLASVGHDLRTPLSSLRLAVDTLRAPDIALADAERRELLDTVAVSTARLDELIANLLDLSRLEAGTLLVQPEPTALDGVVASAVVAREPGTVDVRVADDLPLVLVDPVLLERVLENLVSNAVRHGGAGRLRPVEVSASPRSGAVVVDVVDHGPGLAGASGASSTADGGTGTGLEIVRGFCASMDLRLELLETYGGGLTARISLPVARGGAS
jgi:K+-sensing histidine kinase KdpD